VFAINQRHSQKALFLFRDPAKNLAIRPASRNYQQAKIERKTRETYENEN